MNKLKESKFFLNKMKEEYTVDPDFIYYLSAFISAGRSILWVMRNEYVHIDGWEKWYNSKKPTEEEDRILLKKINDIRLRTVKTKTLHTATRALFDVDKEGITEEIKEYLQSLGNKKISFTIALNEGDKDKTRLDENGVTFTGKIDGFFRKIEDFPEEDILKVCERYINNLEELVLECEKEFGDKLESQFFEGLSIQFTDPDLFK